MNTSNLNYLFGMYDPDTDPIIINISNGISFVLNCKNAIPTYD